MNIKYWTSICLAFLCIFMNQSCKKGCTNKTAYNYVKTAKVDDGSCLYCDSSFISGSTSNTFQQDFNSSSPYFDQSVLEVILTSNYVNYNGNGCKLLGVKGADSLGLSSTYYTALLQNLTSSNMTVNCLLQIEVFQNSSTILNYQISNVTIPANSSKNINLGSGGYQFEFSSFNFTINNATFSYH